MHPKLLQRCCNSYFQSARGISSWDLREFMNKWVSTEKACTHFRYILVPEISEVLAPPSGQRSQNCSKHVPILIFNSQGVYLAEVYRNLWTNKWALRKPAHTFVILEWQDSRSEVIIRVPPKIRVLDCISDIRTYQKVTNDASRVVLDQVRWSGDCVWPETFDFFQILAERGIAYSGEKEVAL